MRALAPALVVTLAPTAASAQVEEIVPGATYEAIAPGDIPARVHLVTVDLTATELRVDATPDDERGQTTSAFAASAGAALATNGGAFSPLAFAPYGVASGAGAPWPDSDPDAGRGALVFARAGPRTEATALGPADPPTADAVASADAALAVGTRLVEAGEPRAQFDCGDRQTFPCERAPRTAAGLADDGARLLLAVADGWQAGSEGATAADVAGLLADRGADDAFLLDGGSAATLYAEPLGGLVSSPSDGAERRVANHLAVFFEELEPGSMTVFVREGDANDPDADLPGATVTLDDGRDAITDDEGAVEFADIRPRLACATARADGFDPATVCRQVPPGDATLATIALLPEGGSSVAPAPPAAETAPPRDRAAAGCSAAPGRLHRDNFRVTLGTLLAAALLAAAARRRELSLRRPHRR